MPNVQHGEKQKDSTQHLTPNAQRSTLNAPTPQRLNALPARRGITLRAVLLGTLLTPLNAFWVIRMEEVMFGPYPSLVSLFANCIFLLFLLIGLNRLLLRWMPRRV